MSSVYILVREDDQYDHHITSTLYPSIYTTRRLLVQGATLELNGGATKSQDLTELNETALQINAHEL